MDLPNLNRSPSSRYACDISETGALLELGYGLLRGTPVALFLESGPADPALRAVVLHCRDTTGYMAQIEFVAEQPEPAREALRRCIDDARVDSGAFVRQRGGRWSPA